MADGLGLPMSPTGLGASRTPGSSMLASTTIPWIARPITASHAANR